MKIIFLITLLLSYLNAEYKRDASKQVIIDSKTDLMWQDDDKLEEMNWVDALNYCKELRLASYDDWRLPKVEELNSIVKVDVFENKDGLYNWSSTTYAGGDIFAWHINLKSGYVNINIKKDKDTVRCVR